MKRKEGASHEAATRNSEIREFVSLLTLFNNEFGPRCLNSRPLGHCGGQRSGISQGGHHSPPLCIRWSTEYKEPRVIRWREEFMCIVQS